MSETEGDAAPVTESESKEVVADEEYVPQHVLDGGRDFRVEGNDVSGYIGVDPEYMTYADVTQKPFLTDQERFDYTNQYDHLEGNADEESDDDKESDAEVAPEVEPSPEDDDLSGGMFA